LSIQKSIQVALERVARQAAKRLGPRTSIAMVLGDSASGEVLAHVGSADYFDGQRRGWIDMTQISRSPGSTLKPLIYGLAFEEGVVVPETIIEDLPTDFAGYRPRNFDMKYQGDVTVRTALQMSLNVPAIKLLDTVGPARLMSRMRRAGVKIDLPENGAPGLAIGLGGAGISLIDLVQLYGALARNGKSITLHTGIETARHEEQPRAVLTEAAAWHVGQILSGITPPDGSANRLLAYKTGTSYGYRDAWSVGYDGKYVIGVWVGRADGASVPGITGRSTAAPVLFEAFAKSGLPVIALPRQPTSATVFSSNELPITLQRFTPPGNLLPNRSARAPAPQIIYPPNGAHIDLGLSNEESSSPLALKLHGGQAPFRWLANGKPLQRVWRRRNATWHPEGSGYSTLTVIDAAGQAASVQIFIE